MKTVEQTQVKTIRESISDYRSTLYTMPAPDKLDIMQLVNHTSAMVVNVARLELFEEILDCYTNNDGLPEVLVALEWRIEEWSAILVQGDHYEGHLDQAVSHRIDMIYREQLAYIEDLVEALKKEITGQELSNLTVGSVIDYVSVDGDARSATTTTKPEWSDSLAGFEVDAVVEEGTTHWFNYDEIEGRWERGWE